VIGSFAAVLLRQPRRDMFLPSGIDDTTDNGAPREMHDMRNPLSAP
jgi:hypothetical protein